MTHSANVKNTFLDFSNRFFCWRLHNVSVGRTPAVFKWKKKNSSKVYFQHEYIFTPLISCLLNLQHTRKVLFCLPCIIRLYFTKYGTMLQRHILYIKLPSYFLTCRTCRTWLNLLSIMTYWSSATVRKLIECLQRTASSESTDLAHSWALKYMKGNVLVRQY